MEPNHVDVGANETFLYTQQLLLQCLPKWSVRLKNINSKGREKCMKTFIENLNATLKSIASLQPNHFAGLYVPFCFG